jgi:dihydrofolate reductase
MSKPLVCAVAAMDENRVIGNGNKLPGWDIPEDLEMVKELTKGCPLIMGRATFESIHQYRDSDPKLGAAWPNRLNIVVSKQNEYFRQGKIDNVCLVNTPENALNVARDFASKARIEKIFIFGGGTIYKALRPKTERLYLTEVEGSFDGDVYFPEFKDDGRWQCTDSDQQNNGRHKYAFNAYDQVRPFLRP